MSAPVVTRSSRAAEERRLRRVLAGFDGEVRWHEPLAAYTTLGVGGPATVVALPRSVTTVSELVRALGGIPWWVIGRGSNLLVPDTGLDGVVIVLGRPLSRITVLGADERQVRVRVQAGCSLARLIRWCVDQGFAGIEFLSGVPGTVGGAVAMNAGAWGGEIGERVESLLVMAPDGTLETRRAAEIGFAYRRTALAGGIVLEAVLRLRLAEPEVVDRACQEFLHRRLASQPLQAASAGSFFKNPAGDPAGRLIERAGMKGFTVGGAKVSEKHANFIVNTGTATAADIHALMLAVQQRVAEVSGVMLEPEVRFLGDWPPPAAVDTPASSAGLKGEV